MLFVGNNAICWLTMQFVGNNAVSTTTFSGSSAPRKTNVEMFAIKTFNLIELNKSKIFT